MRPLYHDKNNSPWQRAQFAMVFLDVRCSPATTTQHHSLSFTVPVSPRNSLQSLSSITGPLSCTTMTLIRPKKRAAAEGSAEPTTKAEASFCYPRSWTHASRSTALCDPTDSGNLPDEVKTLDED